MILDSLYFGGNKELTFPSVSDLEKEVFALKKRLFSLALLLCMLLTLLPMSAYAEDEGAVVEDAVAEEITLDEPAIEGVFAEVLAPEEEVVEVTAVNEPEDEAFVADLATDGHDETIPQEEAMNEVIAAAEASDEASTVDAIAEEKTVFEDSVAEETLAPTDAMTAPEFEMEASGTDVPALRGDTPITSVIVTITPPLAGQNPDRNPTIPNDATYQAPLAKWLDTNGNTIKQNEVFEAGQTYTVYIMVQPTNGYSFPEMPAVCKINDHSNCGYSVSMDSSIGKNSLIMSTSFVAKNAINTASILITKPAVGAKPDYNPTLQSTVGCTTGSYTNGYYYKNDVIWYDKTTRNFLMPDQDVFLPGHEYNVRINLLAEDGFTFTDSTSGTINGNPISEFINYPSGMVNTNGVPVGAFEYDFPRLLFSDVADPSAYYYDAVYWAAGQGITSGTSATTFSPGKDCTRGQIVTFLWKAMKSPNPSSTSNPFTDVKSSDYFYKPVLWAKEKGITSGTSATTFSPGKPCTRGQIVTFLWKALGSPEPSSMSNPFTDVKTTDYFYKPVLWAKEKGITSGTTATTFSPGKTCTRGQAMTFLYKAVG